MVNGSLNTKKKVPFKISEICSFNKSIDNFVRTKSDLELEKIVESCLNSSTIVKNNEGQIFISKIVSRMSFDTHEKLLEIIKELIPRLNSNLIMSYGKIMYLLWLEYKNQTSVYKIQDFEEKIQESFCFGSIRLEPVLAIRVRLLLHHFYDNRDQVEINNLLIKLYDPIIWRFLSVANWKVRLNSTAIFAILFPLIDSSLNLIDYKIEIERQYTILQNLLTDKHPEVRIAAIQTVCRILTLYWEITPIEKIHEFLDILTSKCIEDKSSKGVRIAVINGVNVVLNNPLSQSLLKDYLKKICSHIHDLEFGVRYSVALIIVKISKIEGMDYTKIISTKQILSRISKEFIIYQFKQSSYYMKNGFFFTDLPRLIGENTCIDEENVFSSLQVARLLSELLNPSIFYEKTPKEQLKYCHFFCDQCPIGMVGYFNSLKISVDESIGKNIPNSELLRLSVLLITSTVDSYQKKKIGYHKASILLESSKELLKPVFDIDKNFYDQNEIENNKNKGFIIENGNNTEKIAVRFFINSCSDELFDKIDPKDRLWVKILKLLLHQSPLLKEHYPKLSKKITLELWNLTLYQINNGLDNSLNKSLFDTIIPISHHWKLFDQIYRTVLNGCHNFLLNKINKIESEKINEYLVKKVDGKNSGVLCLQLLNNILRFTEVRNDLSNNRALISDIYNLAKSIISLYIGNSNSVELCHEQIRTCNELFISIIILMRKEEIITDLLIILLDSIYEITNKTEFSFKSLISYYELFTSVFIFVGDKIINNGNLLDKVRHSTKLLANLTRQLLENNEDKKKKGRILQGLNFYIYGIKRLFRNSDFEYEELVGLKSNIDVTLQTED